MTIKINPCFYNELEISEHRKESDIIILYGGASSGKSFYTIGQRVVLSFLNNEKRNWLILRKIATTVNGSVMNEFKKGIEKLGVENLFKENKKNRSFTYTNGYQVIFSGLDNKEKIKSITPQKSVFTDIIMEEATEFEYYDFKQLEKRLRGKTESKEKKQIWMLFNPIYRSHWIFENFFKNWTDKRYPDGSYHIEQSTIDSREVLTMRVTYRENAELEKEDAFKLKNEPDKYIYDVYTEGKFGVIGDVIFKNWSKTNLLELEKNWDRFYHGLDFGFNPDPNAYVKIGIDESKKEIYIFREWSGTNLDNEQIAYYLKEYVKSDLLYCDSAEPKSIKELSKYGLFARAVKKGQGSIETGIKFLKKYNIIVDYSCKNVIEELSIYKNKVDKNGITLPYPEDKNNHFIDAIRYALNDKIMINNGFYTGGGKNVKW